MTGLVAGGRGKWGGGKRDLVLVTTVMRNVSVSVYKKLYISVQLRLLCTEFARQQDSF